MAGHAQLKFVMTECLKTQIRKTGLIYKIHLLDVGCDSATIVEQRGYLVAIYKQKTDKHDKIS